MATERGTWGTRAGFILAAAGSAVGLGNIWGFPTQVGQGGGAVFVLVYLICVVVICAVALLEFLDSEFDGIRFYAAASSPTRSRRTWAGLR